jgi:cytochrome c oxidase cbb3-type subunit 3
MDMRMSRRLRSIRRAVACLGIIGFSAMLGAGTESEAQSQSEAAAAPPNPAVAGANSLGSGLAEQSRLEQLVGGSAEGLLKTPVSHLFPGGIDASPKLVNPAGNDPAAAARGMHYFTAMNCVGCHAPNGGGGMGRALSNRYFQYGSSPAEVYLSIVQGRPNGMPAWGATLPPHVVWDLVAYIERISKAPQKQWGTTISAKSPDIEQVPAEYETTDEPWSFTEPFGYGQKPSGRSGSK